MALARLRERDYGQDHPLVKSLLDRLGETAGVRRRNSVARWFDPAASGRAERSAERARVGSVKEQRQQHRDYLQDLAGKIEAATRGHAVTRRQRSLNARGGGMSLEKILSSSPDVIRKNLSEEALEWLARENGGPPLPFDAWRRTYLGAKDRGAVASHQRRTGGYFSEHG